MEVNFDFFCVINVYNIFVIDGVFCRVFFYREIVCVLFFNFYKELLVRFRLIVCLDLGDGIVMFGF